MNLKRIYLLFLFLVCALCGYTEPPAPPLHPILEPAFQQFLNTHTNSVLTVSDEIQLLVDGKESYPVRWRMLEEAKRSIYFTTMYIFPDDTTIRLRDMLIRKHDEGVDIKMLVYGPYAIRNKAFFRAMRKHGIEVQMYSSVPEVALRNPFRFWTRHLHDKCLIVDGKEAIVGGMNWSERYASGGLHGEGKAAWRDTDIRVTGPQARLIEQEFLCRWYRDESSGSAEEVTLERDAAYANLIYPPAEILSNYVVPDATAPYGYRVKHLTRFLYQQPFEQNGEALMTTFYQQVIDRAKSHVYWQSIGARPAPIQKEALIQAAARGVDVRLMTNSRRNMAMIPIGGPAIYVLTQHWYPELIKAGVRIFEYQGDAPLHSKGFVVDDVVAAVGSYNATFTSERFYTESAVVVYDTEAVAAVHKMLDDDFAHCKELHLSDLESEDSN